MKTADYASRLITLTTLGARSAAVVMPIVQALSQALSGFVTLRFSNDLDDVAPAGRRIVITSTDPAVFHRLALSREKISADDYFVVCGRDPSPEFVVRLTSTLRVQTPDRITFIDCDLDEAPGEIDRMLRLMVLPDADQRIYAAEVQEQTLHAVNARLEHLFLPLETLQRFRAGTEAQWSTLEMDTLGGRYLHWPELGLHLGWPELKRIENPDYQPPIPADVVADMARFGAALRELREQHRLSRRALVEKIGAGSLSEKTLSRFELGQRFPSAKSVQKIAGAFDMTSAQLLQTLAR